MDQRLLLTLFTYFLFDVIRGSSIVTVTPPSQTVLEGSNVAMYCHVNTLENLTVAWQLPNGNQEPLRYGFLIITAITRHNAGQYKCVATNGTENWTSMAVIHVNYAPEISVQKVLEVTENSVAQFRCDATGNPQPTVYWTSAALNRTWESHTFNITNVTRGRSGIFYCKAGNGIGNEVESSVQLDVQYKPEIDTKNSTRGPIESWNRQEPVTVYCKAQGNPPPQVTWYKSGAQMINQSRNSSRLTFNASTDADFGNYTCNATNLIGEDLLVVRVIRREPAKIHKLANVTATEGSGEKTLLNCSASGDPNPQVNWTAPNGTLMKTGENECVIFFTGIDRKKAGNYTCYAYNGFGAVDRQTLYLDVHYKPKIFLAGSKIIYGYLHGNITLKCSAEGKPTPDVAWYRNDTLVDKNLVTKENGSTILTFALNSKEREGNYSCKARNSVGTDVQVFGIYTNETHVTTSPPASSEKRISSSFAETHVTTSPPVPVPERNYLYYYINGVVGAVLLLILVVLLACCVLRRQRENGKDDSKRISGGLPSSTLNRRSDNYSLTVYHRDNDETINSASDDIPEDVNYNEFYVNAQAIASAVTTPYDWEYPPERLHIEGVIGKGAFCQVAKGYSEDLGDVAVKMLKANSPDSHRCDLLSEVELMKRLDPHPNVVRLLRVITRSEPLMAIVEYIPYGDLLGYLRRSRGLSDNYYKNPEYKPRTWLTAEQLLRFAKQTADGMAFLSKNKIIHRDLAARNVLVGEGETCKVTDFGMARDVQGEDFYQKRTRGRLPIKWTSYEALCYGYYTTQSDVWSFGVVLYEIFTIGGCPYPNMDGHKIAYMLQEGYRMEKPAHVDNELYQMMCDCWITEPERRPTFDDLSKTLARLANSHKPHLMMSKYDGQIYANVDDLD